MFHETNPSLPIPRLESSLYDVFEFALFLEYNDVDDAPLTDLQEVFSPPLTCLPLVVPSFSSIAVAMSVRDVTLLTSPFPLAQCTGSEIGEI